MLLNIKEWCGALRLRLGHVCRGPVIPVSHMTFVIWEPSSMPPLGWDGAVKLMRCLPTQCFWRRGYGQTYAVPHTQCFFLLPLWEKVPVGRMRGAFARRRV